MINFTKPKHKSRTLPAIQLFISVCIISVSTLLFAETKKEEADDNYVIDVLLTEDETLKEMFPKCDKIIKETFILTPKEKVSLQDKLKRRIYEDKFEVFVGSKEGETAGYTVMSQEVGKFHPFTFAVCVKPNGKIKNTAILVYRESRGGEISHKRFLQQFKGKSRKNPIRINKDIINITGATMSVRMMCIGVKKVLGVVSSLYIEEKRTPDSSEEMPFK